MTSLQSMSFLFVSLLFLSCSGTVSEPPVVQRSVDGIGPGGINKTLLLELVNKQRTKGCRCGSTYYPPVGELVWNPVLEKVSLGHSRDMATKKYFAHKAKDGSMTSERLERVGYNWRSYGENIYRTSGYSATEQEVIQAWINSPGHCSNVMGKNFTEMGVAEYQDYWTQVFGSQMPTR